MDTPIGCVTSLSIVSPLRQTNTPRCYAPLLRPVTTSLRPVTLLRLATRAAYHHSAPLLRCVAPLGSDGDGIDNDCDGQIDEEAPDGKDDDGDGDIDEDTRPVSLISQTSSL